MILLRALFKIILLTTFAISLFATEIIIYHTNDVHGRAEESKTSIGYAKMYSIMQEARDSNKNVLYLDAGDTLHGTLFSNLSNGNSIIEVLNMMKLDVMVLGNHDFNYGYNNLNKLINKAQFPVLAANIIDKEGKKPFKSRIIKRIDGLKIGIFGLSTPETKYKTSTHNVKDLEFLDVKTVAQQEVQALQKEGVDFIIALVHLGVDPASKPNEISKVIATVKGIDLIIDGHSHTLMPNGETINQVLITQTGSYGEHLGKIIVNIDNKSKTTVATMIDKENTETIQPDKNILRIIDGYNKKYAKTISKKVSYTPILLEGSREIVRKSESNLGMLITDAMRDKSGADVALINGGGIRTSINKGNILYQDILSVLPFNNILILMELKGSDLEKALEHSVSSLPEISGGFLHASGISFEVNTNKKIGQRVNKILINSVPLDKTKTYKVALTDFTSSGGDGYTDFTKGKIISNFSTVDEIFVEYLKKIDLSKYDFSQRIKIN